MAIPDGIVWLMLSRDDDDVVFHVLNLCLYYLHQSHNLLCFGLDLATYSG